jgi:uncharacterized SAM-binding protein YcdF (DUF218 family)
MASQGSDKYDVIVVLGARQAPDGAPGPVIERRMAEALRLWREGHAANLLLSGGATLIATPEAETMAGLARAAGVPDTALHLEARSTCTLENAVFSIKAMRANGWREALVVTDDFHMRRALYCFHAMGQPVTPARVRNPMTRTVFLAWLREILGRMIYPRQVRAYLGKW